METTIDTKLDDALDDITTATNTMTNKVNTAINNANEAATNADQVATQAKKDVADAIAEMNQTLQDILEQIEGGMEVSVPVGTTLFATSSSTTFFSACFGGTWEVVGNIDTIVVGTNDTVTLYLFRKIAN